MSRFDFLEKGRCRLLSDTINWAIYGKIEDESLGMDAGFNAYYGDLYGSGEETFPRHMAHRSIEYQKANLEINREHIEKLKKKGIAYIYYSSSCTFDQTFFDEATTQKFSAVFKEFKWAFNTENRMFACFNSPEWLEFQLDKAEMLVGELDLDGIFFDNIFYNPCICENCVRKFREDTGGDLLEIVRDLELKDIDEKLHHNEGKQFFSGYSEGETEWYRDLLGYSDWRLACIAWFFRKFRTGIEKRIGRKFAILGNTYLNCGEGMELYRSGVFDAYYSENGFSYPPETNIFTHKIGNAIDKAERKATIIVSRVQEGMPTPGMIKTFLAEGAANMGFSTPWGFYIHESRQLKEAVVQYVNFFKEHEELFAGKDNLAEAAVVMPVRASILRMHLGDNEQYLINGCNVASKMLCDLHILHDILFADDRFTDELLARYKTLVFPEVDILSEENYSTLERFAACGGTVLATGNSFLMDENLCLRKTVLSGENVHIMKEKFDREYISQKLSDDYKIKDRIKKFKLFGRIAEIHHNSLVSTSAGPMTGITIGISEKQMLVHCVNYNINHGPYSIRVIPDRSIKFSVSVPGKVREIYGITPDHPEKGKEKLCFTQGSEHIEFEIHELEHYYIVEIGWD